MGKKKKPKKYAPKSSLSEERVQRLIAALDDESLPPLEDGEVTSLAAHFAESEDVSRLGALFHATANRTQKKEVNKALFKLKQRGLDVPDLKERPEAVQIAAGPVEVEDLPVLMSKPDIDGQRGFLFAQGEGRDLLAVEAQFMVPTGLVRLSASKTSRTHFRKYTRGLATKRSPRIREPADNLLVDKALRKRKLWEIGLMVRAKKVSGQIDRALLDSFEIPEKAPPHPAWKLELDDARPLSMDELGKKDFVLRGFFHPPAHNKLRAQIEEWQAEGMIRSGIEENSLQDKLDKAVGDWANQWGYDLIAELLLDSALFFDAAQLSAVASTFRTVVNALRVEQRDRQIDDFLRRYVRWNFLSKPTKE